MTGMNSRPVQQRVIFAQQTEPPNDPSIIWLDTSTTPQETKTYDSNSETWVSVGVTDYNDLSNLPTINEWDAINNKPETTLTVSTDSDRSDSDSDYPFDTRFEEIGSESFSEELFEDEFSQQSGTIEYDTSVQKTDEFSVFFTWASVDPDSGSATLFIENNEVASIENEGSINENYSTFFGDEPDIRIEWEYETEGRTGGVSGDPGTYGWNSNLEAFVDAFWEHEHLIA